MGRTCSWRARPLHVNAMLDGPRLLPVVQYRPYMNLRISLFQLSDWATRGCHRKERQGHLAGLFGWRAWQGRRSQPSGKPRITTS
jgi:hypothetical protein